MLNQNQWTLTNVTEYIVCLHVCMCSLNQTKSSEPLLTIFQYIQIFSIPLFVVCRFCLHVINFMLAWFSHPEFKILPGENYWNQWPSLKVLIKKTSESFFAANRKDKAREIFENMEKLESETVCVQHLIFFCCTLS